MEESGGLRISGDPPLGQPYTSEFYSIKLFFPPHVHFEYKRKSMVFLAEERK